MMPSTRVMRAAGLAGVLAAVLILGGLYLATMGSGAPAANADAGTWAAWARAAEGTLEVAVYVLLFPGLLLFLGLFAALASLLPTGGFWTRLAGYGAAAFFIFMAAGGVMASTSPSTVGFYPAFADATAVTVFTTVTAGYHLQALGVWTLALAMAATTIGLRSSGVISARTSVASLVLAALAAVANYVGFGIVFGLVWIVGGGIWLIRREPSGSR